MTYFCDRQNLASVNSTTTPVIYVHELLIISFQLKFEQILTSNEANLTCLRIFLVTVAILGGVLTYWIQFRMLTIQGLFLPSLVHIGRVVSEEIKMLKS